MKLNLKPSKKALALSGAVVATSAIAATLMLLDPPVVVSTSDAANNAFKAKMGWISVQDGYRSNENQIRRSGTDHGLC